MNGEGRWSTAQAGKAGTGDQRRRLPPGYWRRHVCKDFRRNAGSPAGRSRVSTDQPDAREGQAGPRRVTDGAVVLTTPGNAGRGKGLLPFAPSAVLHPGLRRMWPRGGCNCPLARPSWTRFGCPSRRTPSSPTRSAEPIRQRCAALSGGAARQQIRLAFASGNRSTNSLPLPRPRLWASMVPPWSSTSVRTRYRPSPVPGARATPFLARV
jgi:hypothetical protein